MQARSMSWLFSIVLMRHQNSIAMLTSGLACESNYPWGRTTMLSKQIISTPRRWTHTLFTRTYKDSLIRNSIYIMGTTIVTAGVGYLYWIVAAHIYSAHAMGLASALIGAMTLASLLANLGIGSAFVQILPRRAAGQTWSRAVNAGLLAGTLSSLLAGGIALFVLPLVSVEFGVVIHQAAYAISFVAGVLLTTLSTLLDQIFVAERRSEKMLVRNMAFALLKLPLLLLPLMFAHRDALGIFSSWVLAAAISLVGSAALFLPRLGRAYTFTTRGLFADMRSMLSLLAGHHMINLGGMIPMYLLPVFVTIRLSATDNAYFYSTWMMGSMFSMVAPAVATSLYAEGSHEMKRIMQKTRSAALTIAALLGPAMVVAILWGHIILSLFGPGYAQHGALLLTVLALSAVPDAITSLYTAVFRMRRHLHLAVMLNLGMALLTLTIAWFLLPSLGIVGAGIAWMIAQSSGTLAAGIYSVVRYVKRTRAESLEKQLVMTPEPVRSRVR